MEWTRTRSLIQTLKTAAGVVWRDGPLFKCVVNLTIFSLLLVVAMGEVNDRWGLKIAAPGDLTSPVYGRTSEAELISGPLVPCWNEAIRVLDDRYAGHCLDATRRYLLKAIEQLGGEAGKGTVTVPQVLYWIDNLLVDAYTAAFMIAAVWAYQRRTGLRTVGVRRWPFLLACSLVLALAGALSDHAENFWALAKLHNSTLAAPERPAPLYSERQLAAMATVSIWKFRLFVLNSVFAVWWIGVGFLEEWHWAHRMRAFRQMSSDEKMKWLFRRAPGEREEFWKNFAGARWEEAAQIPQVQVEPAWLCHGSLFVLFIHGQLRSLQFEKRHFCSNAAYRHVAEGFGCTDPAALRREVEAYLHFLSRRGYLAPDGRYFEVVYAGRVV